MEPMGEGNLHKPKNIFDWVKRKNSLEGTDTLHWGQDHCPQGIGPRVKKAETGWGALWETGKSFQATKEREKLPEITLERLNHVLKKISPYKALGPDHWHPKKILALPGKFKQGLIHILHKAENEGNCPEGIKKGTIALINKPGRNMTDNFDQLDF